MNATIAAVLIAKDEEKVIGRCLEVLQELDEIVVLDTGSQDGTCLEAERHGATVFRTPPIQPFHFAEARNRALAHAKSKWILTIDADEILLPESTWAIRRAVGFSRHTAFRVGFRHPPTEHGPAVTIPKTKLFKKDAWLWRYRVHEELHPVLSPSPIGEIQEATIEHLPEKDKASRSGQNLELLKIAVVETPWHLLAWKKLGMEYFLRKEWTEAIRYLEEFVRRGEETPLEKSETLINLGRAYQKTDRLEDAIKFFDAAARTAPDRREPHWHAALAFMEKSILWEAVPRLEACLAIPVSRKPSFWLNLEPVWGTLPKEALETTRAELARAKALWEAKKADA